MATKFSKKNLIAILALVVVLLSSYLLLFANNTMKKINYRSSYKLKPQGALNLVDSLSSPLYPTELAWDGNYLWVAENNLDKIHKIHPGSGGEIKAFEAPGNEPSGLTWDGNYIWCADWGEARIYKIDPSSGETVDSFESPGDQPTGLAWDGNYLWNADNLAEGKIFKLNPSNGVLLDSFNSPEKDPKGLTWDGTHILVSTAPQRKIYKIDQTNGRVVADFDDPAENDRGLAWDGEYLWESDHLNDQINKLLIQDQVPPTWDEIPTNQTIKTEESFIYDINASDNVAIDHYWINNTDNFQIDSEGVITNLGTLSVGNFWLEIRAYDTSGNYVSTIIKITVESKLIPGFELGLLIMSMIVGVSIVVLLINKRT